MKQRLKRTSLHRLAIGLSLIVGAISSVLAGPVGQTYTQQAALQHVASNKSKYAQAIVDRWEASARTSGRWDANWHTNLYDALINLSPDNLLAAYMTTTLEDMMAVLASGPQKAQMSALSSSTGSTQAQAAATITPQALGQFGADQVYTPITPCKIVDTRVAGGKLTANTTRTYDVDGSTFSAQGGFNGSCGVAFGVASAVAMAITVIGPSGSGFFRAWGLGTQPAGSTIINFVSGQTMTSNAIVPVVPGGGNDFSVWSSSTTDLVVDVVGYFAAPAATALDCITVTSNVTPVGVNVWTPVDAVCPAGRTVTGGGHNVPEGTLGRPGVWVDTIPNGNGWRTWVDNQTNGNRNVQTFAVCCRIPGR